MTTPAIKRNLVVIMSSLVLGSLLVIPQLNKKTPVDAHSTGATPAATATQMQITNGATISTSPKFLDIPSQVSASGFRFYCRVSHFSYDDPIVAFNKPDTAHLHMYSGNTATNANSTASSLASQGNSSCTGGTINKSAYWMPAVLNANNEPLIPEFSKMYYKAHEDVANTQRVPNGLQLIAANDIQGCGDFAFDCTKIYELEGSLRIDITMPNCLQVDANKNPILSSADHKSHSAFGYFKCPPTHPYRIPMISNNYNFNVPLNSNWKLSSDISDPANIKAKGSTLHADAFISWSDEGREAIFSCIRKSQNCELWSTGAEDKNVQGQVVYTNAHYTGDFTPLGVMPGAKEVHNHTPVPVTPTPVDPKPQTPVTSTDPKPTTPVITDPKPQTPTTNPTNPITEERRIKDQKISQLRLQIQQKQLQGDQIDRDILQLQQEIAELSK
jgi:hypothetical protein